MTTFEFNLIAALLELWSMLMSPLVTREVSVFVNSIVLLVVFDTLVTLWRP